MDVQEAIRIRRSIRRFKPQEVEDDKLKRILDAARWAPSWGNVQPWRFILIKDAQTRSKLAQLLKQKQIERAPVVIACCGDLNSWKEYDKRILELGATPERVQELMQDPLLNPRLVGPERVLKLTCEQVMLAIQNMSLAAVAEGLGSCIIGGRLPQDQVKQLLEIPDHVVIVALLSLGYPDEQPASRPRLSLDQICFRERWGAKWSS